MYGLPQAGILAQELLKKCLNKNGYCQSPITPGLWRHGFCLISFTFCADNFGIKYVGREHIEHLSGILNEHYKCFQDWDGAHYLGMNIDWDYINKNVLSPCLIMYLRYSYNSNMRHRQSLNTNHIHTSNLYTVHPNNMWRPLTCPHPSPKRTRSTFRR
jgi:hypothetical protein